MRVDLSAHTVAQAARKGDRLELSVHTDSVLTGMSFGVCR